MFLISAVLIFFFLVMGLGDWGKREGSETKWHRRDGPAAHAWG